MSHSRHTRITLTSHSHQVLEFLEYTNELFERFKAGGPGRPLIELPDGLDLLHEFQVGWGWVPGTRG